jgi:hypothetical protein
MKHDVRSSVRYGLTLCHEAEVAVVSFANKILQLLRKDIFIVALRDCTHYIVDLHKGSSAQLLLKVGTECLYALVPGGRRSGPRKIQGLPVEQKLVSCAILITTARSILILVTFKASILEA